MLMNGGKDLAPSAELRKWFKHGPVKWDEFRRRYRKELRPKILSSRNYREKNIARLPYFTVHTIPNTTTPPG